MTTHPFISNHGPVEVLARAEALGFPELQYCGGSRRLVNETAWRERIRSLYRAELRELAEQLDVLEQRAGARR